jgi:hypothetical protein
MVADMRLDTDQPAGTPRELFVIGPPRDAYNDYGVTPDGQRFLAIVPEDTAGAAPRPSCSTGRLDSKSAGSTIGGCRSRVLSTCSSSPRSVGSPAYDAGYAAADGNRSIARGCGGCGHGVPPR